MSDGKTLRSEARKSPDYEYLAWHERDEADAYLEDALRDLAAAQDLNETEWGILAAWHEREEADAYHEDAMRDLAAANDKALEVALKVGATIAALQQKVRDAEWLADEFYSVTGLNLADATEPEHVVFQVYNRQGELIGDALCPTYWNAIRAARKAGDDQPKLLRARNQPCGCVVCNCDDPERCHGCGACVCGEDYCVFRAGEGSLKVVYESTAREVGEGGE